MASGTSQTFCAPPTGHGLLSAVSSMYTGITSSPARLEASKRHGLSANRRSLRSQTRQHGLWMHRATTACPPAAGLSAAYVPRGSARSAAAAAAHRGAPRSVVLHVGDATGQGGVLRSMTVPPTASSTVSCSSAGSSACSMAAQSCSAAGELGGSIACSPRRMLTASSPAKRKRKPGPREPEADKVF